ncbi:MAG: phosphatidylglycerophosphatase A [Bacteroidaceae bacterium]|nr:phosphatidylglycerophosphatase A [Bacteroidaceae bacterium]
MKILKQTTLHNGKAPFLPAFIGTGFGSGYWPWGPGTAGALVALLIWFGLAQLVGPLMLQAIVLVLSVFFYFAGVWAADRLEPYWGEDPSRVVVDEMVGTWIALMAVPAGHLYYGIAAFVLFRFFDMYKPFGVRHMESMGHGTGVMMDDVLAGMYAFFVLYIFQYIIYPIVLPIIYCYLF